MAGITLAQAETRLQQYLDAEAKVLAGQRVELDGASLTRANLEQIQTGITAWDNRVKALGGATTSRARTVRPGW